MLLVPARKRSLLQDVSAAGGQASPDLDAIMAFLAVAEVYNPAMDT